MYECRDIIQVYTLAILQRAIPQLEGRAEPVAITACVGGEKVPRAARHLHLGGRIKRDHACHRGISSAVTVWSWPVHALARPRSPAPKASADDCRSGMCPVASRSSMPFPNAGSQSSTCTA